MAELQLTDIPRKLKEMPPPGGAGLAYPALLHLSQEMAAQDPLIHFDSTRPLADEFWNLIDGQRSIGQIAEELCFQFGFQLDPTLFLPFAAQLAGSQLIDFAHPEG